MKVLEGKSVFRDICEGPLFFYRGGEALAERHPVEDKAEELERFARARRIAVMQLGELYDRTMEDVGAANAAIFEIHQMMVEDPEYVVSVENMVNTQGVNLEYAIQITGENMSRMFHSMEDAYMRERAQDVRDISQRLLKILTGQKTSKAFRQEFPEEPSIIVADDLMPSETVQLSRHLVLGFLMRRGSTDSHTAILARSMGIPALVCVGQELSEEYDGSRAIVDGYAGILYVEPDAATREAMREKKEQSDRHVAMLHTLKGQENVTRDGRCIKVFANAGSLEDVEAALLNDAGGIGLLRSEILYLGRDSAPDEETQADFYRQVLERMQGREVVIRTMDIGADKKVPYLGLEREANPALGLRAIRLGLQNRELLRTQLRALYRAGIYGKLSIMYPMITSPEEIEKIREIEEEARRELDREGIPFAKNLPTGIMIETPAAALLSDRLAEMVDFFSVGTNDLTQYTLALDRQNGALACFDDPEHRAVMKLIEMAAENARRAGIWIGICGELAADPALTEQFLRMGIDELSVAPASVLSLRQRVRELDLGKK